MVRLGRAQSWGIVLGMLVLAELSSGCGAKGCTLIGCTNNLGVGIKGPSPLPDGKYELGLELDGRVQRCDFNLLDGSPVNAQSTNWDCGDLVKASFERQTKCTVTSNADQSSSTSCVYWSSVSLQIEGNPSEVGVVLTHEEQQLVSDQRKPSYSTSYPNGEECGGGCSQGGYELSFEQ